MMIDDMIEAATKGDIRRYQALAASVKHMPSLQELPAMERMLVESDLDKLVEGTKVIACAATMAPWMKRFSADMKEGDRENLGIDTAAALDVMYAYGMAL